jgi:hypothetical protein
MRVLYGFLIAIILLVQYAIAGVANVSLTFDPSLDQTKPDAIQFEGFIIEQQRKFYAYTTSRPGTKKYTFKTHGYLKFDSVSALTGDYSFIGYVGDDYCDITFRNTTLDYKMLLVNGGYDKQREHVEGFLRFIE